MLPTYAPSVKKLMGHIAFGAFVPIVTFEPLKLVLKFHIWIPHKNSKPVCFSFPSYLPFWSYVPLNFFENIL